MNLLKIVQAYIAELQGETGALSAAFMCETAALARKGEEKEAKVILGLIEKAKEIQNKQRDQLCQAIQQPRYTADENHLIELMLPHLSGVMLTTDMGRCQDCGSITPSGQLKICQKCLYDRIRGWILTRENTVNGVTGDKVTATFFPVLVEIFNDGEGILGEYQPENPDDVNLLRFSAYLHKSFYSDDLVEEGISESEEYSNYFYMAESSCCTQIPAGTQISVLKRIAFGIAQEFADAIKTKDRSIRLLAERFSWLDENSFA